MDRVQVQHMRRKQNLNDKKRLCKVRMRTADADGGWRMANGGRRTADGGRRTADGGRRTADGGRRTADGGRDSYKKKISNITFREII